MQNPTIGLQSASLSSNRHTHTHLCVLRTWFSWQYAGLDQLFENQEERNLIHVSDQRRHHDRHSLSPFDQGAFAWKTVDNSQVKPLPSSASKWTPHVYISDG